MNINSLTKIAKTLDSCGKFILADKIDNFIKISQEATPSTVTQLPGKPTRFRIPGMFGDALTTEGLRGGTQGFQYLDPKDPFYDPIKGALFQGTGPDQAYVNKDFISGKDYLKGMDSSQGQLDIYNKIRQQLENQQSTFTAPYAAKGRIDQEISFLTKTLQRFQNNPYEAYRVHKNNLIAVLREGLANQNESQWAETIQYFKSKMPTTFTVQANEVVNQAKQEALARQQSRGIKTQETAQSLMTNPETLTQSPQTPAPAQQPAQAPQVAETPEQKTIEAVKYKEFLTNFQGYLKDNDVNSMIAVRNLAKQTFKNTNRLDAFKTQTDQLAKQKGIDISKF
jgi:hypothetical protein